MLDPNGDYLVSAWNNHVYPLAAQMNMPLKRPPIQPRSRRAHEAAQWAGTQNHFKEYHLALFQAFFEYGKDISDIEVLKALASHLKLDPISLEEALVSGEFSEKVVADEDAAKRAGVRAVPAFVINGEIRAAGVQSTERLGELISSRRRSSILL